MLTPPQLVQKRTRGRWARSAILVPGVIAALALSSCAKDGGAASAGGGGNTAKVGMIVAETGPIAAAGTTFANGARIAEQQINSKGMIGDGKKIELVAKEGSEDPSKSASVAAQLSADQEVVGLTGAILSTVAGAVKPVAVKQKLPFVIWGATETNLANPPYVFRTVTMPQPANEQLAKDVAKKTGVKTVAYAVMTDNAGIVSQGDAFKKGMQEAGVKDLGQVGTLSTQTDFSSSATSLIQKKADVIAVAGLQPNAIALIAALHDKGYKGQIISGETISGNGVYKSQPQALAPVSFPVYFLASDATGPGKDFATAYKAKYGEEPDDYAAQGYMAVYTIAMGLKKAGNAMSRAGLSKALTGMTSLDNTIYGKVTFDKGQLDASSNVKAVHYTAPDGVIAPWTGK